MRRALSAAHSQHSPFPSPHAGLAALPCPSSSTAVCQADASPARSSRAGALKSCAGGSAVQPGHKEIVLIQNGHLQTPGKKPGDLWILIEHSFTTVTLQRASSPDKLQSCFPEQLPASSEPPPTVGCAGLALGCDFYRVGNL